MAQIKIGRNLERNAENEMMQQQNRRTPLAASRVVVLSEVLASYKTNAAPSLRSVRRYSTINEGDELIIGKGRSGA